MSNTNTNLQTQTSSVLHNDIVSLCSTSKVQEKTQLSKERCMKSLRAIQSQFKFLTDTLQDFGTMPIFKRTFAQDLDLLEQHLTKEIISQTDCKTILTKLRTTFENAFNSEFKARMQKYTRFDAQSLYDAMICNMDSIGKYMLEIILHQQRTPQLLKQKKLMQTQEDHSNPIPALNVDSLKVDLVVIQNTCSEKEDSNSETASSKSVKESSLDSATKDVHAIKYKMSKAKERCMAYFRSLHSHLQVLSKEDLKGTRIEHGFKRAFMSLFGQDVDTFTSTMLLNVDQLQKQLDKDEFQEDGSMAAFWVVNNQFQKFIDSQFTLDYDSQMTDKYFVEYTGIEIKQFRDTLIQHMGNVKKVDCLKNTSLKDNMKGWPMKRIRSCKMSAALLSWEKFLIQMLMMQISDPYMITEHGYGRVDMYHEQVNSRAKVKYHKTRNSNKPADQKSHIQKVNRQIFKGHRFPSNKSSVVYEKTSPRSDLRWKPTGRIFKTIGLRWVPTGKILASYTSKDDSEPTHSSNVDIPNIHKCKETLDLSAADISETSVEVDSKLTVTAKGNFDL
ncbi:hypothetical protein Tco_1215905 [Tanacetum coccineum]